MRVIAINAWNEPLSTLRRFARSGNLDYTLLQGGGDVFANGFKGKSIPTTYVIDPEGRITFAHHGWATGDDIVLAKALDEALHAP